MSNIRQQEEKYRKMKEVVICLKNNKDKIKSVRDLINILGPEYKRTTVTTYLSSGDLVKLHIINENEQEIINKWLRECLINGKRKGGQVSQNNNGFSKDDKGRFTGGKK